MPCHDVPTKGQFRNPFSQGERLPSTSLDFRSESSRSSASKPAPPLLPAQRVHSDLQSPPWSGLCRRGSTSPNTWNQLEYFCQTSWELNFRGLQALKFASIPCGTQHVDYRVCGGHMNPCLHHVKSLPEAGAASHCQKQDTWPDRPLIQYNSSYASYESRVISSNGMFEAMQMFDEMSGEGYEASAATYSLSGIFYKLILHSHPDWCMNVFDKAQI